MAAVAVREECFQKLLSAVIDGRIITADWRENEYEGAYNWHILHRSTRPGVAVQLSFAYVTAAGDVLPTMHVDINDFSDFQEELPDQFHDVAIRWRAAS